MSHDLTGLTKNIVVKYFEVFLHKRSVFQSTGVRSTGNIISGHYKRHYFLPVFSSSCFPPLSTFLIERVLGSKNLLRES